MRIRTLSLCALFLLVGICTAFAGCRAEQERSLYTIEAIYEDGVLTATLDLSYFNDTDNELTELDLNLFGNAYREGAQYAPVSAQFSASAYYGGKSYGGMDIAAVGPCAAWEVAGEDRTLLRVTLAESVFPGERTELSIDYTLRLANIDHRTGIAQSGVVNLGNFYPTLCVYEAGQGFIECPYYSNGDPFYTACADYDVTLTASADLAIAASGIQVGQTVTGNARTARYTLENARDFALVLGKLQVAETTVKGVTVRYYHADDGMASAMLGALAECFAYFWDTYGAYPYKTFSAVQTGFCYGGMEYPGLVLLSDELTGKDAVYTAVHETAHQWWYAAVGSDPVRAAWQDEGLAEYSTLQFFESHPAHGITREGLVEHARAAYDAFCTVRSQVFGQADTSMDRSLGEYGEYEYVALTYVKGLLLFETVRESVGDAAFVSGLRTYYARYRGSIAPSEALAGAWGEGTRALVQSFVGGTAVL